jgi:putative addiction module antidote
MLYICITEQTQEWNMSENQKEFQSGAGTLQVRKIGNSIGFILPKDTAARLDLKEGDRLFLLEQPGGGFVLTPHDPDFERTMELADEIMDKYRDTLAALAK